MFVDFAMNKFIYFWKNVNHVDYLMYQLVAGSEIYPNNRWSRSGWLWCHGVGIGYRDVMSLLTYNVVFDYYFLHLM